jgi:hypothetical protein
VNDNDILNEVRRLERQKTDPKFTASPNHELRKALAGTSINRFRVTDQTAIDVHPHGEWVRFEDWDALRAEVERLTAELVDMQVRENFAVERFQKAERQLAAARVALRAVQEDLETASETWLDSSAGPATVPGEPRPASDLDVTEETQELVRAALGEAKGG